MQVLRAKKRKEVEGREKPIWTDVGFTLLIGEWQGRTTYTLVDERTQEKFSLFPIERKGAGGRPAPDDSGGDIPTSGALPTDSDVPF